MCRFVSECTSESYCVWLYEYVVFVCVNCQSWLRGFGVSGVGGCGEAGVHRMEFHTSHALCRRGT